MQFLMMIFDATGNRAELTWQEVIAMALLTLALFGIYATIVHTDNKALRDEKRMKHKEKDRASGA